MIIPTPAYHRSYTRQGCCKVPKLRDCGILILSFRVCENRFVEFRAVGDRENLDFLCLTSIFEEDRMVRNEGLLDSTVIHKPSRVLHQCCATGARGVLIFQPKDAQCPTADVVASLSFVLVEQL